MATAKALTAQEIEKVLAHIAQHAYAERNRLMLLFTVAAGLRVSEVAGLTIGDVRNDDGTVRSEIYLAAHRVKHGHARTIFLNARLQQELASYIATRNWLYDEQPLFNTHRGQRCAFSANTLTQHFYWLYKKVGLVGASSHSGRRTFITNLAAKGVGVRVIMGLSGHAALSSVQCYIDCNDDMTRKAVELI